MTAEEKRLAQHYDQEQNWLKWGPYLSERQWGTVREDYSQDGNAWNYVSHDMARSKAYKWGEDGIAGISDDKQKLCLSLALWNGKDPILKERLFGLANGEGNHGEDVKELYYYLDNVPTHSYQQYLYKYPQQAFPYNWLVEENRRRNKQQPEFELTDTGIFSEQKYYDVFIDYAKDGPDDIYIRYTVFNRGPEAALLHLIPQIFYRNTWSARVLEQKPLITYSGNGTLALTGGDAGNYFCYADGDPTFLLTNNETNQQRLSGRVNHSPYVKDAFHERIVFNNTAAVNPAQEGTKAGLWYQLNIPAGGSAEVRMRLVNKQQDKPLLQFDKVFADRKREADEFYAIKQEKVTCEDEKRVQRQAWAGMFWNKQFYSYNVNQWLHEDPDHIHCEDYKRNGRNSDWKHFVAEDIISMPDKWEYPWFAAWDHAFHALAFAPLDPDFAKDQLKLFLEVRYMHPNGQLPAYEWDFSDVNPPVHAMAAYKVFKADWAMKGKPDYAFLEGIFQKLLMNFTWWVNRKDSNGNNIFEGGFLGLDNIGIFNRSAPVPGGGYLEQADGTSWMAMYSLNLTQIAMELALYNPVYKSMVTKFSEHFLYIAGSITHMGEESQGLWDDQDGFYYDVLRRPDGSWDRLRLRSIVGLIPMYATILFDTPTWEKLPDVKEELDRFSQRRPDLAALVSRWKDENGDEQHLMSLLRGHRLKLLLKRMLDTTEFLSDYGVRSLSKIYEHQPYAYFLNGADYSVRYVPGESETNMFGGNSNWRGPIWLPLNYLLIDALYSLHDYYTADFRVEYPTNSGQYHSLAGIAAALSARLKKIFLRDEKGERPVFGGDPLYNKDPHFSDYILFYEYFNGDNGKGHGASHQTGWTGLIAVMDTLCRIH
ncbi:glucosidase [uncultured Chitinophaga sp.]|uniref:MGH1-like glycoside hydrolase domain-containing protein n=1 Tax=uncultured Chitinophaga sp. TaxID=339340 RepID=UPI0025E4516F|nr:glucosidase [uncultured Chitinophaga sp.]